MLAYFLKVNVAIALFYAFYRLFFYKDTFFSWRRTALLCFFAVSAAVPLLNIQTWITEQEPMVAMADLYATTVLPEFTLETEVASTDWRSLIREYAGILYWGVAALLALRFMIQLAGIIRLACQCRQVRIAGVNVHLLPQADGPFSFFRWIFVHPSSHTEEELSEILTHEQTHARQWHSIDVIISELACIFCWFNPFAWLMKREIRTNLEYMADARVLEHGYDSKTYQYHLLGLSHQKAAATIYNSFNVLPLKKRIKMMNKKRTREIGRTKYLMFLPLAALLMIVSNIEAVARTTKEIAAEVIEAVDTRMEQAVAEAPALQAVPQPEQDTQYVTYKGKVVDKDGKPVADMEVFSDMKKMKGKAITKADGSFEISVLPDAPVVFQYGKGDKARVFAFSRTNLPKDKENWTVVYDESRWHEIQPMEPTDTPDNPVFEVVEKMPEFPEGGMPKLMAYLAKNIRYPEKAQKEGTQGRVTVQFIVEKDGSISHVKPLRGVQPELDAEAVRVISSMPKWKPGTQRGEAVRVRYTVPVVFRLTGENTAVKYIPVPAENDTTTPEEGGIFEVVEQMPEYPGGMSAMMEFISKNIKYPEAAQKAKTQGRVIIQFIVDTEGNVTSPKIIRGVDPQLDAEAIRLTTIMPKWKPGSQRGQTVNVKYTVPIMFQLTEPDKEPGLQNASMTPNK
ncbi:MAG: TonB family protein [Bacteroides sp.]|nr:TonB family protein [Bacteroides sp.]